MNIQDWFPLGLTGLISFKSKASSVQLKLLSHVRLFVTPWTAARFLCPSLSPWVYSNSSPSNQWCHVTISSSVTPFLSCLQSFPASGSFPMSQFFESGGQSIGASASVLLMNIRGLFPLGLTGLISLLSKGLLESLLLVLFFFFFRSVFMVLLSFLIWSFLSYNTCFVSCFSS